MKKIEQQNKPKRKTHTSTAVTQRYQKKVYKKFTVAFRKIEDADLIEKINKKISEGCTTSEAFKSIMRNQ